jgi:DNA-binding MarR family transcriptional regulator
VAKVAARKVSVSGPVSGESDEALAAAAAERVWRIARRLRRASQAWLAPFGLTDAQARVLRMLGRADGALRMSEIARKLDVVPRSATTVVEGLEGKGLVTRVTDLEDRRSVLVEPTPAGAAILEELARARNEVAVGLFSRCSPSERAELVRLLSVVAPPDEDELDRTREGPR